MKYRYDIYRGANKLKTKTTAIIAAATLVASGGGLAVAIPLAAHAAGNPSADSDCSTVVTDPYTGETGTRANLYGCKSIGNSGDEQGIYTLKAIPAGELGYTFDGDVTCNVLVKWSGNYGETPYLDYGTVYNHTSCSNGYVENWGDNFGANDAYGSTPYVWTIKGQGDQVHHLPV